MIHRLAQKIKEGTKFFIQHREGTNSHEGRETVGEVLTSFVKEIGGKLSNIIIGHFPYASKVKDANVCSMEANITTSGNIVDDVNEVSGVALGNSNIESPAFPGALRLNTVQCFGENTNNNSGEGENNMPDKSLSFHDIKDAIKDMNIFPWQIFTPEEMQKDKVFGKLYEDNSILQTENESLKTKYATLETSSKESVRANNIIKAQTSLEELMKEGFTDKQKTFIKDRFKPETLEKLDEPSLKEHLENEKKVFSDTAKLFGVESSTSKSSSAGTEEEKTLEEQALEILGV